MEERALIIYANHPRGFTKNEQHYSQQNSVKLNSFHSIIVNQELKLYRGRKNFRIFN